MKYDGMMKRCVTWVHLPTRKMVHWERLGGFSLIVAGGGRRESALATSFVFSELLLDPTARGGHSNKHCT